MYCSWLPDGVVAFVCAQASRESKRLAEELKSVQSSKGSAAAAAAEAQTQAAAQAQHKDGLLKQAQARYDQLLQQLQRLQGDCREALRKEDEMRLRAERAEAEAQRAEAG